MYSEQLKTASNILRATYPKPLISRTVDANKDLQPIERQILFESSRMNIKRLLQHNPR